MNGVPAPLAEDEDSDFGRESWFDRKDDRKRKTRVTTAMKSDEKSRGQVLGTL